MYTASFSVFFFHWARKGSRIGGLSFAEWVHWHRFWGDCNLGPIVEADFFPWSEFGHKRKRGSVWSGEVRKVRFWIIFYHMYRLWSWASYSTSLVLRFLLRKLFLFFKKTLWQHILDEVPVIDYLFCNMQLIWWLFDVNYVWLWNSHFTSTQYLHIKWF